MIKIIISKSKTLISFVALELIIQALTLSIGFFLVRSLTKNEYALYTVANSMQSAMALVVDSGISVGILAIGGAIFGDRYVFSQLIKTSTKLRRIFLGFGLLIIAPLTAWLLLENKASEVTVVSITLFIVMGGCFQVLQGPQLVIVRLARLQNKLQIVNLIAALFRGIFLASFFLLATLTASLSIFSAVVALAFQTLALTKLAKPYLDKSATHNNEHQHELIITVKKVLPGSVYALFQGQIAIALLSIFGNNDSVADLGALGRIGMIFAVVSSVMANIIIPRFAQIKQDQLKSKYSLIVGIYILFGFVVTGTAMIIPELFLWILGEKYSQLKNEVILIVVSSLLSSLNGYMWSLNAARGWLISPVISVGIGLFIQLIMMIIFGVSTVNNMLMISFFVALQGVILNFYISVKRFNEISNN
jgi:O-antigen/teichoic acid export membrane protein